MKRFKTLLQREWMQHQRGWLVLMALPIVVITVAGLFGEVHADFGEVERAGPPGALMVALATVCSIGALSLTLAWLASLLQSPGLARRDVQDRSIEFWLSLPTSHLQSLGATLLTHLLLFPWLALLVGLAGGLLASLLLVTKAFGIGAWFGLPWASLIAAFALLALRLMLGLLLASLWLSPLILGTMAASAWLKRWGVPVVVGVLVFGGLVLDKVYGNPIVWELLRTLTVKSSQALIVAERGDAAVGFTIQNQDEIGGALQQLPGWLLHDAGSALMALASPAFVGALLAGAAGFGALWLRRQRGA